jgi:hypothetical protein
MYTYKVVQGSKESLGFFAPTGVFVLSLRRNAPLQGLYQKEKIYLMG